MFSTGLLAWVPALPPYVACQPTNINALAGYPVTLPTRVGGVPEAVYQWYKGTSPVVGATGYTLTLSNAQTADSGTYSLRGTNDYGSFISGDIVLSVTEAVQPTVGSAARLSNGSFALSFSGAAGQPYRVWGSTDVTRAPIADTWTLLSSGTFSGSAVNYIDTQATNLVQRFYSISVP